MRIARWLSGALLLIALVSCNRDSNLVLSPLSCAARLDTGIRRIATTRDVRFEGKVTQETALCRGGETAAKRRALPWVDWENYFGTADAPSLSRYPTRNWRGVAGALVDLEYQRAELIKFNLFDNSGTFEQYLNGIDESAGAVLRQWPQMRLPPDHPNFEAVGGGRPEQLCKGKLIRARTLTGICNDLQNPLMGSTGTLFARNMQFEATFPDLQIATDASDRATTMAQHAGRISLLTPDPQVISRRLFTREQSDPSACDNGHGKPGFSKLGHCDYTAAPFFNVLAAFWIQFMTHDWFSHLEEGHNDSEYMKLGCTSQKVKGFETPLTAEQIAALGCRPDDQMDKSYVAEAGAPASFMSHEKSYYTRAPKTYRNTNTAWWDASQIYGFDANSYARVKRDPNDPARLLMVRIPGRNSIGDRQGYLPVLESSAPQNPDWAGQESAAFADNWTVGLSFFHNLFAREHNQFVDEFRRRGDLTPDADSGLRNPEFPDKVIRYRDVEPEELFEVARLVIAAEIAKIHTIEWTTQLLYNEPLYRGMNGNWNGLVPKHTFASRELADLVNRLQSSKDPKFANQYYSILAAGPGIFGRDSNRKGWSLGRNDDPLQTEKDLKTFVNGGTNHFGSPFNFPEEFVSVYRLHALVPDLLDYRVLNKPNDINGEVPVVETFRGLATPVMRERGLANWGLSLGRQRLGALALHNHPRFLQNLQMNRLEGKTKTIDVAALDIIRDRERGVPRFNEFRRQYGLRSLTSFDDFINQSASTRDRSAQSVVVKTLREIYGQHPCNSATQITVAQRAADGKPIDDCFGNPNGTLVDNIEDLDTMVGWLAESTRPHGFAISETQFVVFILNASRRLYSDRFFTSSFRPEFYSKLGIDWVNNNGPEPMCETFPINGHSNEPVSPLKRILLRTIPELADELAPVANAFDPWARDRGRYYSLDWRPRRGAESDPAFATP
jgi:hypothetical protein